MQDFDGFCCWQLWVDESGSDYDLAGVSIDGKLQVFECEVEVVLLQQFAERVYLCLAGYLVL